MKLNLYDNELNRIAFIDESFISVLWVENYNSTGKLTLELPTTEEFKLLVKPECYVGRWDRKTLMVIKSVIVENGTIVATGETADRQLDDVAFIGTTNIEGNISSVVKSAYQSTDSLPFFTIADSDLIADYKGQISNKSMKELIEKICQMNDIGYRAVKNGKIVAIEFYKPTINENLKFSNLYGNLQNFSFYNSTEIEKNYAIVLGTGQAEERIRIDIDIRRNQNEQKKELIVDARELPFEQDDTAETYNERLKEKGIEKLLECSRVQEIDFSPIYQLGKDFELGDILTALLNDYGIKIQARIISISQKQQNNSLTTEIELGNKVLLPNTI